MSTKIEWCEESWNPITGCTKISEGCKNCYAEKMAKRLAGRFGYPKDDPFKITLHPNKLNQPLKWKEPRRIFVCSMSDLFHPKVSKWFLGRIFDRIFYDGISHHKFLILTKRPKIMYDYFKDLNLDIPDNVWLGVSVENQKTADERIPILLQIPAKVRFVSVEPMLGAVDLRSDELRWCNRTESAHECDYAIDHLDWVICGGESGSGARPMHPDWVRSIRDQCIGTGVPFFFKQWGEWSPDCLCNTKKPHRTIDRPTPGKMGVMFRCGKKKAGRLLDGQEYNQYPQVTP